MNISDQVQQNINIFVNQEPSPENVSSDKKMEELLKAAFKGITVDDKKLVKEFGFFERWRLSKVIRGDDPKASSVIKMMYLLKVVRNNVQLSGSKESTPNALLKQYQLVLDVVNTMASKDYAIFHPACMGNISRVFDKNIIHTLGEDIRTLGATGSKGKELNVEQFAPKKQFVDSLSRACALWLRSSRNEKKVRTELSQFQKLIKTTEKNDQISKGEQLLNQAIGQDWKWPDVTTLQNANDTRDALHDIQEQFKGLNLLDRKKYTEVEANQLFMAYEAKVHTYFQHLESQLGGGVGATDKQKEQAITQLVQGKEGSQPDFTKLLNYEGMESKFVETDSMVFMVSSYFLGGGKKAESLDVKTDDMMLQCTNLKDFKKIVHTLIEGAKKNGKPPFGVLDTFLKEMETNKSALTIGMSVKDIKELDKCIKFLSDQVKACTPKTTQVLHTSETTQAPHLEQNSTVQQTDAKIFGVSYQKIYSLAPTAYKWGSTAYTIGSSLLSGSSGFQALGLLATTFALNYVSNVVIDKVSKKYEWSKEFTNLMKFGSNVLVDKFGGKYVWEKLSSGYSWIMGQAPEQPKVTDKQFLKNINENTVMDEEFIKDAVNLDRVELYSQLSKTQKEDLLKKTGELRNLMSFYTGTDVHQLSLDEAKERFKSQIEALNKIGGNKEALVNLHKLHETLQTGKEATGEPLINVETVQSLFEEKGEVSYDPSKVKNFGEFLNLRSAEWTLKNTCPRNWKLHVYETLQKYGSKMYSEDQLQEMIKQRKAIEKPVRSIFGF